MGLWSDVCWFVRPGVCACVFVCGVCQCNRCLSSHVVVECVVVSCVCVSACFCEHVRVFFGSMFERACCRFEQEQTPRLVHRLDKAWSYLFPVRSLFFSRVRLDQPSEPPHFPSVASLLISD